MNFNSISKTNATDISNPQLSAEAREGGERHLENVGWYNTPIYQGDV